MSEEDRPPTGEASLGNLSATSAEPPKHQEPEALVSHESSTKGMLREAIHKVMGEIEYHEREAKRHLQLADELRKDLRESFAFMIEQRGGGSAAESPEEEHPGPTAKARPPEDAKEPAPEKHQRGGKKRNVKKTRA